MKSYTGRVGRGFHIGAPFSDLVRELPEFSAALGAWSDVPGRVVVSMESRGILAFSISFKTALCRLDVRIDRRDTNKILRDVRTTLQDLTAARALVNDAWLAGEVFNA